MYHYDTLQFRECQEGSMDYKMSKFDIDRIACLMYRDIAAYIWNFCGGKIFLYGLDGMRIHYGFCRKAITRTNLCVLQI